MTSHVKDEGFQGEFTRVLAGSLPPEQASHYPIGLRICVQAKCSSLIGSEVLNIRYLFMHICEKFPKFIPWLSAVIIDLYTSIFQICQVDYAEDQLGCENV